MELSSGLTELRRLNERVPRPARLPTQAEVEAVEARLGVRFHPGGFEELFVKYRTDGEPAQGEGFIADATKLHASEFEVT